LVRLPIYVARQWIRHRASSTNEFSARYSIVPDEFDLPPVEDIRRQSTRNRQGRAEPLSPEVAGRFRADLERVSHEAYSAYTAALEAGVARETARTILPLAYYTQWYWKINLWNLLHFLSLRLDAHSQEEIRVYAAELARAVRAVCPIAYEAFEDFVLEGLSLSRKERRAVRALLEGSTPEKACADAGLLLTKEDGKPLTTGEGIEFLEKLERIRATP
ncbi:MAG: FAD-dependent thymidylate synthase, partial [Thermoplasmata archaeon]|nr:FAD-dependent thymidylate synthase [Thermoplasmata archaeon]